MSGQLLLATQRLQVVISGMIIVVLFLYQPVIGQVSIVVLVAIVQLIHVCSTLAMN